MVSSADADLGPPALLSAEVTVAGIGVSLSMKSLCYARISIITRGLRLNKALTIVVAAKICILP